MPFAPLGLINRSLGLKYMAPMGLGAALAYKLSENGKSKNKKPVQQDSFQKTIPPAKKETKEPPDAAFWMNDEELVSFMAVDKK